MLPLAALSRLAGRIANREIPEGWRCRVLGWYARMFGVDISEAADEDLTHYRSLGEFFRRSLKPGMRPVDAHYSLVIYFGRPGRFSKKFLFTTVKL